MTDINNWLVYIASSFILLALLISLISLIRFSSIFIRLVALEVLTNLFIAGVALWALTHRQPLFIDICLALALIMFLSVVAYYRFLSDRTSLND